MTIDDAPPADEAATAWVPAAPAGPVGPVRRPTLDLDDGIDDVSP